MDKLSSKGRGYWHRWLLVIPFIWQIGCVPLVNDIAYRPFSMPFPMVWQMAGILVTTAVLGIVFVLDRRIEPDDGTAAAARDEH